MWISVSHILTQIHLEICVKHPNSVDLSVWVIKTNMYVVLSNLCNYQIGQVNAWSKFVLA